MTFKLYIFYSKYQLNLTLIKNTKAVNDFIKYSIYQNDNVFQFNENSNNFIKMETFKSSHFNNIVTCFN